MAEREVRWLALVPLALVLALASAAIDAGGLWGRFSWRPQWLWLLALYTAVPVGPVAAVAGFGFCGLVQDILLSGRPGCAVAAFALAGWAVVWQGSWSLGRSLAVQAAAAGLGAAAVLLLSGLLELGTAGVHLWGALFWRALGSGVLSLALYVPFALVLSLPPLCTNRPAGRMYV